MIEPTGMQLSYICKCEQFATTERFTPRVSTKDEWSPLRRMEEPAGQDNISAAYHKMNLRLFPENVLRARILILRDTITRNQYDMKLVRV
jgi:hypothetical protein